MPRLEGIKPFLRTTELDPVATHEIKYEYVTECCIIYSLIITTRKIEVQLLYN